MPKFHYTAKNIQGVSSDGAIEAESLRFAAESLQKQGLFITALVPDSGAGKYRWFSWHNRSAVTLPEIAHFTQRLADLTRAGLPLAKALQSISRQKHRPGIAAIIARLQTDVVEGKRFSDALSRHETAFPQFFIGAVRAGESAGFLDMTLSYLAEFLEKEQDLKNRLRSALAYPALMLIVGMLSVAFLLIFVIPRFSAMFQDLGQSLPLLTRSLIAVSGILRDSWWVMILCATALMLGALNRAARARVGAWWQTVTVDIPVWGAIVRKEIIARFARILKALIHNGVPLADALMMTRGALGNPRFSRELAGFRDQIANGKKLSDVIALGGLFPSEIAEMISVGEESGAMEEPLGQIARMYERDVEQSLKTTLSLFEPLIIVVVGCMVGCVALAMLLPIFQVSAVIR